MACHHVDFGNGSGAIVCDRTKPKQCACGRRATRLCDWKVDTRRSGTCDKPLCANCAFEPAPEKDLCSDHAVAFADWKAQRERKAAS